MAELFLLREALLLAMLLTATYTDLKKGLIFDRLTLPMIAVGAILNIVEQEFLGIGIGIIVFAIGYLLYYAGKIGGGDVKMFTATTMLLPFYKGEIFILNVLFVASIASVIILSIYFISKYSAKGMQWKENKQNILKAAGIGGIATAYFAVMTQLGYMKTITALFLGIPLAFGLVFVALEKGIRKEFFLKTVSLKELEEDEIIAAEFLEEKAKKELGMKFKGVLGEKEKARLEKAGIKKIGVYRQLPPFAPFMLVGAIASIIIPGITRIAMGL